MTGEQAQAVYRSMTYGGATSGGWQSIAIGSSSLALFNNNIAIGTNAISDIGTVVDANDSSKNIGNSIAIGTNAYTKGTNQIALGANAKATNNNSVAMGSEI